VNGEQVQIGAEWEPVLLTVMRPCVQLDADCVVADELGLQRSSHGFPRALTLSSVCEALGPQEVLVCQEEKGAEPDGGGASGWRVCSPEAMRKTLRELTLRDGDSLLLLPSTHTSDSVFSVDGDLVTLMTPSDCRWLQVQFRPQTAAEEEEGMRKKIPASGDTLLGEVKQRALEELQLQEQFTVREDLCLRDAGIRLMTSLFLCPGPAPKSSQLFLYCRVSTAPSSDPELELIVEEMLTVKECVMEMVRAAGLEGTCWHVRRMDWCEEVGEPLRDENSSLLEVGISNGDTLMLTEGQLPPKGFLKLMVSWYEDPGGECVLELSPSTERPHTAEMMKSVGFVEISEEASLQDLRCQVLTLPALTDACVPTPEFLRVWLVEDQRLSKILRGSTLTLRKLKVVCGSEVCVQKLQCEENLGVKEVLLRVQMGVPGERAYYPFQEFVWDAGRDPSAKGLYHSLSSLYGVAPENLLLAKHLTEKHTWMPIHNWRVRRERVRTQQVSKRKKKKRVESLQGAPYYLRDGDVIGVKNLLVDSNREFSTLQDEEAQQKLREQTESRRKDVVSVLQSEDSTACSFRAVMWDAELPLCRRMISVCVFIEMCLYVLVVVCVYRCVLVVLCVYRCVFIE
ncbi:hypothetical protein NFI96_028237, partial [Prochilodus magdalenae]